MTTVSVSIIGKLYKFVAKNQPKLMQWMHLYLSFLIKRVNVLIIHKHIHQTKQSQSILRHHQYALLNVDIAKYDNLYEN